AALGAAADALAVSDLNVAVEALSVLREQDGGRAGLLVAGTPATVERSTWPEPPPGARWALDLVTAPQELCPALHRLLERTAVVRDLRAAQELVAALPTARAVTVDGDLLSGDWAHGGSGRSQSVIEVQAAIDEAQAQLAESDKRIGPLTGDMEGVGRKTPARAEERDTTLAARREWDARLAAVAEQLAGLGQAARSASGEAERLRRQRDDMERRRTVAREGLAELEERLRLVQDEPAGAESDTSERDEAVAALAPARSGGAEARRARRTAEERAHAVAGRAESLRRSAQAERVARQRAAAAAEARLRGAAVAEDVVRAGEFAIGRIEKSLHR